MGFLAVILAYSDRTCWSILHRRCKVDDDEDDHDERLEQAIVVYYDKARLVARKTDLYHILSHMMLKMWFYHLHQYFNASKWVINDKSPLPGKR